MSTHAGIGVMDDDGSVRAIYVHHDGYLDHVGRVLRASFAARADAEAILALGDLSSLGDTLRYRGEVGVFGDAGTHAYHRDEGQEWERVAPKRFASPYEWHREAGYEHEYLWMPAAGDAREGWYKYVGGAWAPLDGLRVA